MIDRETIKEAMDSMTPSLQTVAKDNVSQLILSMTKIVDATTDILALEAFFRGLCVCEEVIEMASGLSWMNGSSGWAIYYKHPIHGKKLLKEAEYRLRIEYWSDLRELVCAVARHCKLSTDLSWWPDSLSTKERASHTLAEA